MTENQYQKYLASCIEIYIKKGKFFDKWFFKKGKSYYFLFKKNLKVTNIQFVELISLIRLHSKRNGDNIGKQLLFLSVKEFNHAFSEILTSFKFPNISLAKLVKDNNKVTLISNDIAAHFEGLLKNTVVIDTFFGSCAVYFPPDIDINIAKVCAQSGYIHSCGRNIYTRNVSKAAKTEFLDAMKGYLKDYKSDKKIFFAIYAHEDFSDYDRKIKDALKYGLDDVKVYVEKYSMGRDSLVDILKAIDKQFSNSLVIPEAGNFRKKHRELRTKDNVNKDITLWFVIDNSINPPNIQNQGTERYYICYEQQYTNDNQFHLFDETKPAWKSSTTIPHTLLGAMINITLPNCSNLKNIDLADPFSGTGTTFLECYKYPNITPHASDNDPFAQILVKDNVEFFNYSADQLKNINKYLGDIEKHSQTYDTIFANFFKTLSRTNKGEFKFTKSDVKKLKTLAFKERLILYIILRVKINSNAALDRGAGDFDTAFTREVKKLKFQISRFIKLKKKALRHRLPDSEHFNHFDVVYGDYSISSMVASSQFEKLFREHENDWNMIEVRDVRKLGAKKYDVIITDPPYGFNARSGVSKLASLYNKMIRTLIKALKDDGQIVMSLPDKSHSGKISPFFTHKEIVIQQFLMIAQEMNKEIINNVVSMPTPEIFRPPFYWESERALKRSILHFRIRENKSSNVK